MHAGNHRCRVHGKKVCKAPRRDLKHCCESHDICDKVLLLRVGAGEVLGIHDDVELLDSTHSRDDRPTSQTEAPAAYNIDASSKPGNLVSTTLIALSKH